MDLTRFAYHRSVQRRGWMAARVGADHAVEGTTMDALDEVLQRSRERRKARAAKRRQTMWATIALVILVLLGWIGWSLNELRVAAKPTTDRVRAQEAARRRWEAMTPQEQSEAIKAHNYNMLRGIVSDELARELIERE